MGQDASGGHKDVHDDIEVASPGVVGSEEAIESDQPEHVTSHVAPRPAPRRSLQVVAPALCTMERSAEDSVGETEGSMQQESDFEVSMDHGDSEGCDDQDAEESSFLFDDEDQDRPCWTYMSEHIGVDCRNMCLTDFVSLLESGSTPLDPQSCAEIIEAVREEMNEVKHTGCSPYLHLFQ